MERVGSQQTKGNLLGISAILLWSTMNSLMRLLSEALGPTAGAALMYTAATVALAAILGWPSVKRFPRRYLCVVGSLFVAYEIALFFALALANSHSQAIEVSVLNHMWPCLTIALAAVMRLQRPSVLLLPGMAISFLGVGWILSGGQGLTLDSILHNATQNPVSYGLGLSCAVLWALYCCMSKKIVHTQDGTVLFLAFASVTLWIKYAFSDEPLPSAGLPTISLLIVTAVVIALGYAAWNKALQTGNLVMLAAVSYTSPVLSTFLSSLVLSTALQWSFWQGAMMVSMGSIICWWASRRG